MSILKPRSYYKPFRYPWAYDLYKKHEQIHWLPEEVEFRDDIRDWNNNLSDAEKNLLTQLFRFFTQADCYSDDTEILTNRGWVLFSLLKSEDKVAQVDPETRNLSFEEPTNFIKKPFKGKMLGFRDGRGRFDLLVTPNHKMYTTYQGESKQSLAKDTKFYQNVKHHVAVTGVDSKAGFTLSLSTVERLAIAFQADGNVKSDTDGSKLGFRPVRFGFKKQRKIVRLKHLLSLASVEFETKREDDYTYFYVKWPLHLQHLLKKDFSWVDLDTVSSQYCREFIEELSHWDSHVDKWNNITYSNTNEKASDAVQALCVIAGYNCNHTIHEDSRSDTFSNVHSLTIRPRYEPIDGQSIVRNQYEQDYEGFVYCVTVPKGLVVVRRNLGVSISGNCDVADGYSKVYLPALGNHPELTMMMLSFGAREAIHIDAYSLLIETLGMSETTYSAFSEYEEMEAKHDFVSEFSNENPYELLKSLAVYSGFTEGMQLFSSFAILLNFKRFGKMKGMSNIVAWSVRDETIHVEGMTRLFRELYKEYDWFDVSEKVDLHQEIKEIAMKMVELEDAFIDLCFEQGGIEGLTADEVKEYIRFIANRRWNQLGFQGKLYNDVDENPLPWVEEILNAKEHTNFFEATPTEYSKGTLKDVEEMEW